MNETQNFCKCGCGETANEGKTYIRGHYAKDRSNNKTPTPTAEIKEPEQEPQPQQPQQEQNAKEEHTENIFNLSKQMAFINFKLNLILITHALILVAAIIIIIRR